MKYRTIINGKTASILRKKDGRWGKRNYRRLQRTQRNDDPNVLDLFIHESPQSVYTAWKFTETNNDEAIHLPNHLLVGYVGGKLRSFSAMKQKRGQKYLTHGSFQTVRLHLVKIVAGKSILPKDQLHTIPLGKQMMRRLADYMKQIQFADTFCCYDLVAYLHGVVRETPEWYLLLSRLTIVDSADARPGDIVGYVKHGTKELVHVGIFLGDDLVLSRNGINDNMLVNTIEDMRVFYDYHCSMVKPLDVIYGRVGKDHPLFSNIC